MVSKEGPVDEVEQDEAGGEKPPRDPIDQHGFFSLFLHHFANLFLLLELHILNKALNARRIYHIGSARSDSEWWRRWGCREPRPQHHRWWAQGIGHAPRCRFQAAVFVHEICCRASVLDEVRDLAGRHVVQRLVLCVNAGVVCDQVVDVEVNASGGGSIGRCWWRLRHGWCHGYGVATIVVPVPHVGDSGENGAKLALLLLSGVFYHFLKLEWYTWCKGLKLNYQVLPKLIWYSKILDQHLQYATFISQTVVVFRYLKTRKCCCSSQINTRFCKIMLHHACREYISSLKIVRCS